MNRLLHWLVGVWKYILIFLCLVRVPTLLINLKTAKLASQKCNRCTINTRITTLVVTNSKSTLYYYKICDILYYCKLIVIKWVMAKTIQDFVSTNIHSLARFCLAFFLYIIKEYQGSNDQREYTVFRLLCYFSTEGASDCLKMMQSGIVC